MNVKLEVRRVLEGFMGGSSPDNPLVPSSQKRQTLPTARAPDTFRTPEEMEEEGGLTDLDSDAASIEDLATATEDGNDMLAQIGSAIVQKLAKIRR